MIAGNTKSADSGARPLQPARVQIGASVRRTESSAKVARRVPLQPAAKLFSPTSSLVWIVALLGVAACVAPWISRGWFFFDLLAAAIAFLVSYDALALWLARNECAPILLLPEKGLRGGEGQTIPLPLALTSSGKRRLRGEVLAAIMPATTEGETAIRVISDSQHLNLQQPSGSTSTGPKHINLWPWSPEIALLRRG